MLNQVLVMLLYRRLGGICGQMERLAARFQAGRLWRVPARAVAAEKVEAEAKLRAVALPVWPRRFGWLVRLASYHAASYGSQLRVILGQPEMVALLRAAPQAARILRPVCRMLAVDARLLRPRPEGAAEVVPADVVEVVRARVRKRVVRAPVDWGRIPLPRGVLAAARRQGFGKVG